LNTDIDTVRKKINTYIFITAPLITLFVIISILYLDRPIAIFFYDMNSNLLITRDSVANEGSHATYVCYLLIIPVFIYYFYRKLSKHDSLSLSCIKAVCQSLVFAYFLVNTLKYFFGRTSPLEGNTLSFILHPSSYDFHWFEIGGSGASFPSGHMFIFSAIMVSIFAYYHKMTALCTILMCLLFAGLLFFNLHYFSDLIAGTYLGILLATGLYHIRRQ